MRSSIIKNIVSCHKFTFFPRNHQTLYHETFFVGRNSFIRPLLLPSFFPFQSINCVDFLLMQEAQHHYSY